MLKLITNLLETNLPAPVTHVVLGKVHSLVCADHFFTLNIERKVGGVELNLLVNGELQQVAGIPFKGDNATIVRRTKGTIDALISRHAKILSFSELDGLLGAMAICEPNFDKYLEVSLRVCASVGAFPLRRSDAYAIWTQYNMHYIACPLMRPIPLPSTVPHHDITVLAECPLDFITVEGSSYYHNDDAWDLEIFCGNDFDEIYSPEQFAAQEAFYTPDLADAVHFDREVNVEGQHAGLLLAITHGTY